jgi:hypothetical protein
MLLSGRSLTSAARKRKEAQLKRFFKTALAVLALGALVCAADLKYDASPTANFSAYKTFKIVSLKSNMPINQIMADRLNSYLTAALTGEGLTQTNSDAADIYAGWQFTGQNQQQYNTYNMGGVGWGGWAGGGMSQTTTQNVLTGILAIDLYDVKAKGLVWRGTISWGDIQNNPEKNAKNANKEIQKLFQKYYPPPAKK